MLDGAGYAVDYYPGEDVTVDLYRDLPKQEYGLLILRVHSPLLDLEQAPLRGVRAVMAKSVLSALRGSVFLFTSEGYSEDRYVEEQKALRLVPAHYDGSGDRYSRYFAIGPEFVRFSMKGNFNGATIILMGCDGLTYDRTAAAFVQRGAAAAVGWNGLVSAAHTDAATERFLKYLILDRLTAGEGVARTMREVGPDASYGSVLRFYPPEASDLTFP
jgi:hypothetical protein